LTSSSYAYPSSYQSIRDVDFKNLTVTFWKNKNGRPQLFHLRDGKCQIDFHPGQTSISLAGIHYLNSAEMGTEYALVLYEEDDVGGSSNQEGFAQVLEIADKRLRVAQQIDWDLHYGGPYGPLDTFNEKTNTLTIRSSHYRPGDAHCCVSAFDVVTFRWDGRRFLQISVRTELSNYGRLKRKRLSPRLHRLPRDVDN
jgi:hypothetical protein